MRKNKQAEINSPLKMKGNASEDTLTFPNKRENWEAAKILDNYEFRREQ